MVRNVQSILLTVSLLLCSGLASCGNGSTQFAAVPALLSTNRCGSDTSHSYEVFVPARSKPNQTFPLLIILDPHGSGKTALSHFRLGAERYPVVLVASNRIRNNMEGFGAAIQELIDDARKKYPVSEVVLLSGFSGGARMAVEFAKTNRVNGLILSGALSGVEVLRNIDCLVYSITGSDDFNYLETAPYLFQEENLPSNLKLEFTRSTHRWPDSLTLADALGYIQLNNSASKPEDPIRLNFEKRQRAKIDSLKAKGSYIMARWTARNMIPFDDSFAPLELGLKTTTGYIDEMSRLLVNLQMEAGVRDAYVKALESNDAAWWKSELEKVDRQIQTATDPYTQDAYRRIKGFWGIACYSLCNRAVGSNDFRALMHYVSIYRILEPQNPDMLHFSELLKH